MLDGTERAEDVRLKAYFWVAAYQRRCQAAGAFVAQSRRGAPSAGTIFIEVLHADGADLWGPAPGEGGRVFECVLSQATSFDIHEKMEKEVAFDRDLWLITVEDRAGRSFLEPDERV